MFDLLSNLGLIMVGYSLCAWVSTKFPRAHEAIVNNVADAWDAVKKFVTRSK